MYFTEGELYHVFNRGNNKQTIFFKEDDYLLFLRKVKAEIAPYCEILCWCLMPNHFHFMIRATEESCRELPAYGGKPMQALAAKIGRLLSSYSQYINAAQGRTGSLFQQRTEAKPFTEMMRLANFHGTIQKYVINLMHYIHQNPVRAGLAQKMEDWQYSSFRDLAGIRNGKLCAMDALMEFTGYDLSTFYQDSYDALNRNF